jgi:hypothetical protein
VEQIERRVVVMRIDADQLAVEHGFQEIQRRFRRVLGPHQLGVVGVTNGVGAERHVGAIGVLEVRQDGVEAVRFERKQHAAPLPGDEILHGLEEGQVDFELLVGELLFDALVEHVAEAAGHRDLDAGILLLEQLDASLVRRRGAAGVERQRAFLFGLLVQRVERFGGRGGCTQQRCERDDERLSNHGRAPTAGLQR